MCRYLCKFLNENIMYEGLKKKLLQSTLAKICKEHERKKVLSKQKIQLGISK